MKNSTPLNLPTGATLRAMILFAALFASHAAQAQLITPDPSLPPQGAYITPAQVHATYSGPGLTAILRQIRHSDFSQITRTTVGMDERESFFSFLAGIADVTLTPGGSFPNVPVSASGPVETIVFGRAGQTTGTFQTEMLSMMMSGTTPLGPFMIRESPTQRSLGTTSINDLGNGTYLINSFFDVFTELSVDGANWIPDSTGPTRVVLVPEPGSVALFGLALCGLIGCVRRKLLNQRN